MAKQDIQTIIGSSISKDENLLKNFKSIKSCFVGWVESYNETSGTVNVQPAIQDFIPNDEQSGSNYRNSPLLVNVWVLGTFKSTAVEKGDKAVCFVLDQKSNDFFKCIYDSGISLGFQTFKPKTSAQKNICDCVCIILGDASFQELYEAVSAIDTALENKADINGTYPDMTVGNATNAQLAEKAVADENGNVFPDYYASIDYVQDNFAPRSFFENLYFSRTDTLTASLVNDKPVANSSNYLSITSTNTTLDFTSANKLTITRIIQNQIQLDKTDTLLISLSFALNRAEQVEFGARVKINDTYISSNQAFGLASYNGDTGFTNVVDKNFSITFDNLAGLETFNPNDVMTIEIFIRQATTASLTSRYFCGVSISGVDRNCFTGLNFTATSIDTNQILDGAVTTPKLEDGAVTIPKLASDVTSLINSKEPAFSKNTAFNKNFGTTAGTVCEGNDGRLSNARPASDVYAWAKAQNKPTYTKAEVGLGNVDNVRQYSAQNPPPYPVTSVDGKTGAVTLYNLYAPKNAILWMGRLTVGNTITISYQSYSKIKVFYAYYEWEDSTEVDVANAPYGSINVQMSVSQQSTFEIKSWNGVAVLSGNQLNFNRIIVLSNGTSATSNTSDTAFKILRVEGIN